MGLLQVWRTNLATSTSWYNHKAPHQRTCLGASKVFFEWAVVTLVEHLHAQSFDGRDAEQARLNLHAAMGEAAKHQKRTARRQMGVPLSRPGRQVTVCRGLPPSRARWAGLYERVESPSTALGHQVLDEHGREEEVVRRAGPGGRLKSDLQPACRGNPPPTAPSSGVVCRLCTTASNRGTWAD